MSAALMDFGLGETADAIRETTARFAAEKIAPLAAGIDETNTFPRELWPQMGGLGLHGITVEEEWGGLGLGYLEHVVAMEEVSRPELRSLPCDPFLLAAVSAQLARPAYPHGVISPFSLRN